MGTRTRPGGLGGGAGMERLYTTVRNAQEDFVKKNVSLR